MYDPAAARLAAHPPCSGTAQEEGPSQVDLYDPVEVLEREVEEFADPAAGREIDQSVDPRSIARRRLHERLDRGLVADVTPGADRM